MREIGIRKQWIIGREPDSDHEQAVTAERQTVETEELIDLWFVCQLRRHLTGADQLLHSAVNETDGISVELHARRTLQLDELLGVVEAARGVVEGFADE